MRKGSVNPREDLQAIREIMERSSKFLSLSGLSGIFAGVTALAGAAIALWIPIPVKGLVTDAMHQPTGFSFAGAWWLFTLDAVLVLTVAMSLAFLFSWRKARKAGVKFWTVSARRMMVHLMIPLIPGGIFVLILMFRNQPELIASVMLIFYGLALVNAGQFTLSEIHYLGLTEIALGVVAGIFAEQGFLFWTLGFGLMHIVYGTVMYFRHER